MEQKKQRFYNKILKFMRIEDGPTAVEHAIMLALITVVCVADVTAVSSASSQAFSRVASSIKPS